MSTSSSTDLDQPESPESAAPAASRRNLLRLAGAAAAGAAAVAVAGKAAPVSAADNDPLLAGADVQTTAGNRNDTGLIYTNTETPQVPGIIFGTTANANMFTVRDTAGGLILFPQSSSSFPAAIGGYSYRTVANGVYGFTSMDGAGVVGVGSGTGSVGVHARGTRANLNIHPTGASGPTRADAHSLGDMLADSNGNLWYCTEAGTPGKWANLSAGSKFYAITPSRVYDSRAAQPSTGALTAGGTRTLSIKDKRDIASGAVTTADIVPAGATAITANVTVVNTVSSGFLAVNPGGVTEVSAATVNWFGANQILNNGVNITIAADRTVTVVAGGGAGAAADFVIDVTGYFA